MKKSNWTYKVFFITFILAAIFTAITNILTDIGVIIQALIITLVIIFGIIFDMIGVATLTSKEENFHARASKKIKGAKESITLLKNSSVVASFCNDVVGDVCGIVSGGLTTTLAVTISNLYDLNLIIVTTILAALISALTVGGKALGKNIAIKKSDSIIFTVGKIKSVLKIK